MDVCTEFHGDLLILVDTFHSKPHMLVPEVKSGGSPKSAGFFLGEL